MLQDSRISQRKLQKSSNLDEKENVPVNTNTIVNEEVDLKSTKLCKTPLKACKSRCKTPEKQGVLADKSYGVTQKNVLSSNVSEMGVDSSRYYTNGNGGFGNVITPVSSRPNGKGNLSYSTQSTPVKSVTRPPNPKLCLTGGGTGVASVGGGGRMANFEALSKGVPISSSSSTVVNTIEVPHFRKKKRVFSGHASLPGIICPGPADQPHGQHRQVNHANRAVRPSGRALKRYAQ